MAERFNFSPTNNSEYPYKAVGLMPTEDFVTFSSLSTELLPPAADHVAVELWLGDRERTVFYEGIKPELHQAYTTPKVTADQYLEVLTLNLLPLPPQRWKSAGNIYTRNMELHTSLQMPESPDDMQGRVVNTTQHVPPEGVAYRRLDSTKAYVAALEEHGFPRAAFKDIVMPSGLEVVSRGALSVVRAFGGMKPSPDGLLTVAVRTENSRPDIKHSR